jgi:sugar phosphate isomerase/epimerase
MIRPAFSTVACPHATIEEAVAIGARAGFTDIEFRTFGVDSRLFACDPALTGARKVRHILTGHGLDVCGLATSARFDAPVSPPVVGVIGDDEREVRAARRAVDLAAGIGCPLVRVFAFEPPERETRGSAAARILGRLRKVLDHACNTPVRVVIENGGGFRTAEDLIDLIGRADHPLLGACYSVATGADAGDDPGDAIRVLGSRLWLARLRDMRDGAPCPLGDGRVPCRGFVDGLVRAGYSGSLVYDWDRAWLPDLAEASEVLPHASRTLFEWIGGHAALTAGGGGRAELASRT